MNFEERINQTRLRPLGCNQSSIVQSLETSGRVVFRDFCKSQNWYNSYQRSWSSLKRSMAEAGISFQVIPGELGGTWTEELHLV